MRTEVKIVSINRKGNLYGRQIFFLCFKWTGHHHERSKQLFSTFLEHLRPPQQHVWLLIAISYGPMIYTGPVRNAFDAGKSITGASGWGLGPGNRDFFGPCEMASSRLASAIWGPNKVCSPSWSKVQ